MSALRPPASPAPATRVDGGWRDRSRVAAAGVGLALLAALGLAMIPGRPAVVAIMPAVLAAGGLAALAAPALRRLARRHPLVVAAALAVVGLAVAWLIAGFARTSPNRWPILISPEGDVSFAAFYRLPRGLTPSLPSWPWRLGGVSTLPLVLMLLSAGGGLVLISDAVRIQLGLTRPSRTVWRLISAPRTRGGWIASRAVPGIALVALAMVLAILLVGRYTSTHLFDGPAGYDGYYGSTHPRLAAVAILGVVIWSALLVASPLMVGFSMRLDVDKAGRAREEERQRFAAHLHDSVLQTLALVQRQAHDPAVVSRLARRQEYALRAWMAGESDLDGSTVATAVRAVIAEVEDEHELVVQLTAIGDAPINDRGEALVAAAREVLRNSARHAPGAPVYVFLDVNRERAELFIRDEGPGFDPDAIAPERRGLRDAVIGRMAMAGGHASIESTVGEGTEVVLRIANGGRP